MSHLIDLIFSNIVVIFVVVGFIISFISKIVKQGGPRSTGNQGHGRPISTMPSFGGDQPVVIAERKRDIDMRREPSSYSNGEGSSMEWREEPVKRAPVVIAEPLGTKRSSGAQSSARSAAATLDVSKDAMRQGLMWNEILGPPRSKKPYTARR